MPPKHKCLIYIVNPSIRLIAKLHVCILRTKPENKFSNVSIETQPRKVVEHRSDVWSVLNTYERTTSMENHLISRKKNDFFQLKMNNNWKIVCILLEETMFSLLLQPVFLLRIIHSCSLPTNNFFFLFNTISCRQGLLMTENGNT